MIKPQAAIVTKFISMNSLEDLSMKKDKLLFTNKDCIQCFHFVDRELHFIINELKNIPEYTKFFRDLTSIGGSGKHRVLNYFEFHIIGLIKLLNNLGFTIPKAANILFRFFGKVPLYKLDKFDNIKHNHISFSKFLFSNATIHVSTSRLSTKDKDTTYLSFKDNESDLYSIRINLLAYHQIIFDYMEKNFSKRTIIKAKCIDEDTLKDG